MGQRRRVGGNGSTDLSAGCLEVSPIPSTPPTISPHLDEFVSSKRICLLRLFLDSFVGHYLDQKRLKMGLYRHPWDDITYIMPDHLTDLRPASFE